MHEPSALAPLEIRTFVQAFASWAADMLSIAAARLASKGEISDVFLSICNIFNFHT